MFLFGHIISGNGTNTTVANMKTANLWRVSLSTLAKYKLNKKSSQIDNALQLCFVLFPRLLRLCFQMCVCGWTFFFVFLVCISTISFQLLDPLFFLEMLAKPRESEHTHGYAYDVSFGFRVYLAVNTKAVFEHCQACMHLTRVAASHRPKKQTQTDEFK